MAVGLVLDGDLIGYVQGRVSVAPEGVLVGLTDTSNFARVLVARFSLIDGQSLGIHLCYNNARD